MKQFRIILFAAVASLVLASCAGKPIEDKFDSFVNKVESKCDSYTQADWDKVIKEYDALIQEYQQNIDSYTQEQKAAVNKAIGKYTGILLKAGVNQAGKAVQDAIDSASSFIKGVSESLETEK